MQGRDGQDPHGDLRGQRSVRGWICDGPACPECNMLAASCIGPATHLETAGRCTVRGFRTGARWSSGTTSYSAGSGTGTASPLWLLLPLRASCEPIARHCAGSPCLQAPCHVVFVRRPTAANMSLYAHCVSTAVVGTAGLHVRSTSSRKRLGCSPKRGPRARCTAARGPPHIAVSPSFHDRDPPGCKQ